MKKSHRKIITIIICISIVVLLLFGIICFYFNGIEKTMNYIIYVNQSGVGEKEEWTTQFITYENAKEMMVIDEEYASDDYLLYGKRVPIRIHFNSIKEMSVTWIVKGGVKEWESKDHVCDYDYEMKTTCKFFDGKWHVVAVEKT